MTDTPTQKPAEPWFTIGYGKLKIEVHGAVAVVFVTLLLVIAVQYYFQRHNSAVAREEMKANIEKTMDARIDYRVEQWKQEHKKP